MARYTIERHRVERGTEEWRRFAKFVHPPREPSTTLDAARGDVVLERRLLRTYDLPLPFKLPDGSTSLRMWVITDPAKPDGFPAPLVRLRAGQTARIETKTSTGPHTIHWHGIEPTPLNDGVGKHSFEIENRYTYQWTAREPGFFFYHCHRNTPLHFEMGLYGPLIIDPEQGPGFVRAHNPGGGHVVRYDVEAIWVCGAHDHRWRSFSHGFGLHESNALDEFDPNDPDAFPDVGASLSSWRPSVFTISGAVAKDASTPIADPRAQVRARVGQTVLIRLLNASYAVQEYRIGAEARVVAQDGRAYGVPPYGSYSQPFTIPANAPFRLAAAQRHDLLLTPTRTGSIPFEVTYWDWVSGKTHGRARTRILVG